MPRPSKLTDAVADQIVLAVKGASAFTAAAKSAGVGESTYYRWLARGRAEHHRLELATKELEALPRRVRSDRARRARQRALRSAQPKTEELPYFEFAERIEQACSEAQVHAAARITATADKNSRAAAWLVEPRDRAKRGPPKSRVAVLDERDPPPVPHAWTEERDPQVRRGIEVLLAHEARRNAS
jgi:transposase